MLVLDAEDGPLESSGDLGGAEEEDDVLADDGLLGRDVDCPAEAGDQVGGGGGDVDPGWKEEAASVRAGKDAPIEGEVPEDVERGAIHRQREPAPAPEQSGVASPGFGDRGKGEAEG